MKAITIMQPWASLIAVGAKTIETRSWKTNYRGPIAIHASARMNSEGKRLIKESEWLTLSGYTVKPCIPLGCVIATTDLVDCCTTEHLRRRIIDVREFRLGNFNAGRYGWILENVRPLTVPVPAKGNLGIWEWDEKGLQL